MPRGRLTWLARETLECDVPSLVVDATHRLATVLLDSRDAAGSTQAVHAGLRLAGLNQVLWRDLIRAEHFLGGAPAVQAVLGALRAELAGHGRSDADIAPQTHALLGELLPTQSLSF